MKKQQLLLSQLFLSLLLCWTGCADDGSDTDRSVGDSGAAGDSATNDGGDLDSGTTVDGGPRDSGAIDTGAPTDGGLSDTATTDSGRTDIGAIDAGAGMTPDITSFSIDMTTLLNTAPGNGASAPESDNWPITWADDGHQYTSWGDGRGFGTAGGIRGSLGVARISGSATDYSAVDLFRTGSNSPGWDGKSHGLLSIDGELYMWRSGNGSGSQGFNLEWLYHSPDHGVTWNETSVKWNRSDTPSKRFSQNTFVQYGQDYADVPAHGLAGDGERYVYTLSLEEKSGAWDVQFPGEITLMRVRADSITDIAAYEWYSGTSDGGAPTWNPDFLMRAPVFTDATNGMMRFSVIYNIPLRKYILIGQQVGRQMADNGRMGWYQADRPWGPWRPIGTQPIDPWSFGTGGNLQTGSKTVFWNLSQKWMSVDGLDFVMVYTGPGPDQWGTVEGSFTL